VIARDAAALAHRALAAAVVLGLRKASRGTRVVVAELSVPGPGSRADLVVVTDEGRVVDRELPEAMARLRATLGDGSDGVVALMVGSPITRALAAAADEAVVAATKGRADTYARAIARAANRADAAARLAPSLDPARLRALVEAAAGSDLTLVEPELSATSTALSRVRGMRSPRARALLATVALGSSARPLLFVPAPAAPKGGLARVKVDRIADTWLTARPTGHASAAATDVVLAALGVLGDADGPMAFKELLREARERWTAHARASGARATPSAADARELAGVIHQLAAAEEIEMFAVDPAAPAWELTVL
jgi:hypothetical protein